ncbi:MAG: hypothetical protein GY768_13960 [Planctomycetaceae bacterium]|nr:hypothetical protein [Planctomycetaceae bacterium]MCP4285947.1 hypothetical protein [Gammaproteobacteria bacterium]
MKNLILAAILLFSHVALADFNDDRAALIGSTSNFQEQVQEINDGGTPWDSSTISKAQDSFQLIYNNMAIMERNQPLTANQMSTIEDMSRECQQINSNVNSMSSLSSQEVETLLSQAKDLNSKANSISGY